eukprot:3626323-Amphidinium_carterae.1
MSMRRSIRMETLTSCPSAWWMRGGLPQGESPEADVTASLRMWMRRRLGALWKRVGSLPVISFWLNVALWESLKLNPPVG